MHRNLSAPRYNLSASEGKDAALCDRTARRSGRSWNNQPCSHPIQSCISHRREDAIVIGDDRRGEEVPRRSGPSLSCHPRSLGLFPPSIVPNLLSFRLSSLLSPICCLHFAATQDGWVDGWRPAAMDRLTSGGWISCLLYGIWKAALLYLPPSIDDYEHGRV